MGDQRNAGTETRTVRVLKQGQVRGDKCDGILSCVWEE